MAYTDQISNIIKRSKMKVRSNRTKENISAKAKLQKGVLQYN